MNQKRNQKPNRKVNPKYDPYIAFLDQVIKTYTATTTRVIYNKDNGRFAKKNIVYRNLATHNDYTAIHFEWVIYTEYYDEIEPANNQIGIEIHVERFGDPKKVTESENIFNNLLAASATFPGGFLSGPNLAAGRSAGGFHHIYVLKDYVSPIDPHTINWAVTKMIEFQNYFIPILGNLYNQGVIKSGSPNFAKWP